MQKNHIRVPPGTVNMTADGHISETEGLVGKYVVQSFIEIRNLSKKPIIAIDLDLSK